MIAVVFLVLEQEQEGLFLDDVKGALEPPLVVRRYGQHEIHTEAEQRTRSKPTPDRKCPR